MMTYETYRATKGNSLEVVSKIADYFRGQFKKQMGKNACLCAVLCEEDVRLVGNSIKNASGEEIGYSEDLVASKGESLCWAYIHSDSSLGKSCPLGPGDKEDVSNPTCPKLIAFLIEQEKEKSCRQEYGLDSV